MIAEWFRRNGGGAVKTEEEYQRGGSQQQHRPVRDLDRPSIPFKKCTDTGNSGAPVPLPQPQRPDQRQSGEHPEDHIEWRK